MKKEAILLMFGRCFNRKAREDEAAATRRLNEMVANYGDVIPRRDYEQLSKVHEVRITLYTVHKLCLLEKGYQELDVFLYN